MSVDVTPESQRNIYIFTASYSFAMTVKNKDKSIEIISQALGHQSVENWTARELERQKNSLLIAH